MSNFMSEKELETTKGYIMGQATIFFFLSILLIGQVASHSPETYVADTPFFYMGKLADNIPFPMINLHIDFAYWIMYILAFVCLGISIYFFITLFYEKWISRSRNIALNLAAPFSILVFISFILSWANGLASVLTNINNQIIAGIFAYSGLVVFFAFLILLIINPMKRKKNNRNIKRCHHITDMLNDSLPCL